jgi:hypothetical protein
MDYFQGVVIEYLRADRAVFVNTEYLIQIDPGDVYIKGRHWYCDAVAINHRDSIVDLCEVTYSSTLQSVVNRLLAWNNHWPSVVKAVNRDSSLKGEWLIRPHLFVPSARQPLLDKKLSAIVSPPDQQAHMPVPKITHLEDVLPWKYRSWNGKPYEKGNG